MRQNTHTIIAFVLVCLAVSALPVQAADANQLVVGSSNACQSEFDQATLSNVTVEGTGCDAYVSLAGQEGLIEGFEGGTLNGWTGSTDDFAVSSANPAHGIYAVHLASSGTSRGNRMTLAIPSDSYANLTFAVNDTVAGDTDRPMFIWNADDGSTVAQAKVDGSGNIVYYDGSSFQDTGIDMPSGAYVDITTSFDYANNQYDLTVTYTANGTAVGSATNIDFVSGSSDVAEFEWLSADSSSNDYWLDSIVNGTKTTTDVGEGTYISPLHQVDNASQAAVNLTLDNASAIVTIRDNGTSKLLNQTTVSTTANHTFSLAAQDTSNLTTNVTFQKTGEDPIAQLHDESILFVDHAPGVNNSSVSPSDGALLVDSPDELSINVTDQEFDTAQGDEVNVTFYDASDDSVIGSDILTENGTATTEWGGSGLGEREWYAVAKDTYGLEATSDTFTFQTPSELTVREEHDPQQLVDNSTVTLRFYTVNGEIAIQRETDNGTINMDGLPNAEFVVFAEAEGYYDRRIYIESIFEQEEVFLLNETEFPRDDGEAVLSRFVYEDLTGNFPRADTTLQIERSIDLNSDGESEYMTVAGDYWGASNEFEVVLEHGVRYRLVLVNRETGNRHIAGTHIPTEELTQSVRVSGLVQDAANATGVYANAEFNASGQTIDIVYRDPVDETTDLQVVVESQDGEEELLNETLAGPLGTYAKSVDLNESQAEQDWVVRFESDRHQSAVPVGSGSVGLPMAVPSWLLTLLASMAVTFVGALYGPRTALMGAWAMVFVAAGIAMFGWAFSGPSVIVAALVAVGVTLMSKAML